MIGLNRTIHTNEQLKATLADWIAPLSRDDLHAAGKSAHESMKRAQANGSGAGTVLVFALATMKLLELVEQKEREEADRVV